MKELLKEVAGEIPGLGIVVAIATLGIEAPHLLRGEKSEIGLLGGGIIFLCSWLLYKLGSPLDRWIFDPMFSPEPTEEGWLARGLRRRCDALRELACPRWYQRPLFPFARDYTALWCKLDRRRRSAAKNLQGPYSLYKACEELFKKTEEWEHKIRLPLEFSKAARTFIPILGLLSVFFSVAAALGARLHPWTVGPIFPGMPVWAELGILVLMLALLTYAYLRLRVAHMQRLYNLAVTKVRENQVFWGDIVAHDHSLRRRLYTGKAIVPGGAGHLVSETRT